MDLPIYQIDSFTDQRFKGNPAAVIPLDKWLPDETLQAIANENNLSETAFFVAKDTRFQLRWFTPKAEVKLCGHATLAAAEVIFNALQHHQNTIYFDTLSGTLIVKRLADGRIELDLPAQPVTPILLSGVEQALLITGLGLTPGATFANEDLVVMCANQSAVANIDPDINALKQLPFRGIIVTAKGDKCDFVSRFFGPSVGVNEDPVTGSAHTKLMPFWAAKLDKPLCQARQLSERGGNIECELKDDRVLMRGHAVHYMQGTIHI